MIGIPEIAAGISSAFCGAYFAFKLAERSAKQRDAATLEIHSAILLYEVSQHIRLLQEFVKTPDSVLLYISKYPLTTFQRLKTELPGIEKKDLELLLMHFNNIFILQVAAKEMNYSLSKDELKEMPDVLTTAKSAYNMLLKYAKISMPQNQSKNNNINTLKTTEDKR